MPLAKYRERRAGVCACLCNSIVGLKFLTFQETIALQRYVLSIRFKFTLSPKRHYI